jgi:hypothetical protein
LFYYLVKHVKGRPNKSKNRQNLNAIFNLYRKKNDEKIKNGQNDKDLKKGGKMRVDGKKKTDKGKDKKDKGGITGHRKKGGRDKGGRKKGRKR